MAATLLTNRSLRPALDVIACYAHTAFWDGCEGCLVTAFIVVGKPTVGTSNVVLVWRFDVKHAEDIQYAINTLSGNALRSFPGPLVVEHHIPIVTKLRQETILRDATTNVVLVWYGASTLNTRKT